MGLTAAAVAPDIQMPPHTAEIDTPPGLIFTFRFHADGTAEEIPDGAPIDMRHDGWLWLHFNLADARACERIRHHVAELTGLLPPAVALLLAPDERQQLHTHQGCIYGVVADLLRDLNGATGEIGLLHFAMTERVLISGRRHALNAVEMARQHLRGGHKVPRVASLLELIVDHVVDAIDSYEDELGLEMDKIEEGSDTGSLREQRRALARIRKTTVRLHRQLAGLRSLFQRFEKEMGGNFSTALQIATGRLSQRLEGIDHDIVVLRDRAHLLQEEITMRIAEATNRNLHVLAIATLLFLPATLITGVYGMNVKGIPFTEIENTGFLWVSGLLAMSTAFAYYVLKRLGLLSR